MRRTRLHEEVNNELDLMAIIVQELTALRHDVSEREPTNREKTAAAGYLAQFYTGVENILKRISRHHNIPLPKAETWHIDLFTRFCNPPYGSLPMLFDDDLALELTAFRKFRHVVHHGYGFLFDWQRMVEGVDKIEDVFMRLKTNISSSLREIL